MPKNAVIVGTQVLTALGDLQDTWNALLQGKSGLKATKIKGLSESFPTGIIQGIDQKIGSYSYLKSLIQKAGIMEPLLKNTGFNTDALIATTKGAADELLDFPDGPWSGQPWQIKDIIAREFEIKGEIQTISAACSSGTVAIIQAAQKVITGLADTVIVVGIDIVSRFVTGGFASLKGLAPDTCRPFDDRREGLALGEGIGILIITSDLFALKNKWETLATIKNWGTFCDARHITAPCKNGRGLLQVLAATTNNKAYKVGGINAHGTGTVYNDAMELTAFGSFFQNDIPPIHSIKGAIGHCLGAAGVIEAAIAICSLKENCIPPTVGLKNFNLDNFSISGQESLPLSYPSILSCNSGFGGINAGILLEKK